MSLAHKILSKTEAAYQRATIYPKREMLMTDWGDYCLPDALEPAPVPST